MQKTKLIFLLILFVMNPLSLHAQTTVMPIFEMSQGKEKSQFSPADQTFNLNNTALLAGVELSGDSSQLVTKFGINRGNTWGNHFILEGIDDIAIGPVYYGGSLLLFIDNKTEKVFSSVPDFDFNGETTKRFALLGIRSGMGSTNNHYFRLALYGGAGQIILTNRLYINGKLTDDSRGFSREDLLPIVGFGVEGGFKVLKIFQAKLNFTSLSTNKYILNTERLFPFRNNISEISLNILPYKYFNLEVFGSLADHPYGPTINQKIIGIRIGVPIKEF